AVAGTPFTFDVAAKDQYGNTVTSGYAGVVGFTSTDLGVGTGDLPADYTFVSGDYGAHSFTNGATLRTVTGSPWTIHASDGTHSGTSGDITVTSGVAASLVVTYPTPATAG